MRNALRLFAALFAAANAAAQADVVITAATDLTVSVPFGETK
jgi:hypothetical protein